MNDVLVETTKQVPSLVVLVIVVMAFVKAWKEDLIARTAFVQQITKRTSEEKTELADRYEDLQGRSLKHLDMIAGHCHQVQRDSIEATRDSTAAMTDLRTAIAGMQEALRRINGAQS